MQAAVLTVSTSVSARRAEDRRGPVLAARAETAGCEVVAMEVVPDDFGLIEDRLHHYVDVGVDFIFTTGGTGFTPDDITPEATRAVDPAHRAGHHRGDARGVAAAHAAWPSSAGRSPASAACTLIVNFPGSPKAVEECFGVLEPVLAHAVAHAAR